MGLVIIFIIYGIDGMVRICEWHDGKVSKWWLSLSFAIIFLAEWYMAVLTYIPLWILSLMALISVISYRIIRSKLGYPTLLVVGVDVDGVLGEQVPPVLERLKRKKNLNFTKEEITEWDLQVNGTNISKEIEEALLDPNFVKEMPLVQGATDALKQVYKKYHVVIVTSRPLETEKETKDWLKMHFKYHEFINTREMGKNITGINVLIDDNLQNIEAFASSGGFGLLFSQPWNQKIESNTLKDFIQTGKVIRCENWNDVLKALLKIEHLLVRNTLVAT
jgi:5'(3')-deoxyribonucleotidase